MKAITQRESVVTYIKSCLIFQIPRFMLISKYRVISPLKLFINLPFHELYQVLEAPQMMVNSRLFLFRLLHANKFTQAIISHVHFKFNNYT